MIVLVLIERLTYNDEAISASKFRNLMNENKVTEALKLVPKINHELLLDIHRKN